MLNIIDLVVDDLAIAVIRVLAAVLTTAVTSLLFMVQGKVKAWLATKLTAEQMALVEGEAAKFVRYLQQADYLDFTSEEKKERAMLHLLVFCERYNLPFDADDIDQMIEAAVKAMKDAVAAK